MGGDVGIHPKARELIYKSCDGSALCYVVTSVLVAIPTVIVTPVLISWTTDYWRAHRQLAAFLFTNPFGGLCFAVLSLAAILSALYVIAVTFAAIGALIRAIGHLLLRGVKAAAGRRAP